MDYIPTANDLDTEAVTALVSGTDMASVAGLVQTSKKKLESLIKTDPAAREMILSARREYEAFLALRMLLMSDEALDTIQNVMHGRVENEKLAATALRAAETVLDRGVLPRVGKQKDTPEKHTRARILPDLEELVEAAESNEQAHRLVEQHRQVIKQIDALRRGAREVIDGETIQRQS